MNNRTVEQNVEQVVTKGDPQIENHPIQKFPPKLLGKFCEWVSNTHKKRQARNQRLAELRLVCKNWCNSIDSHADYEPEINDEFVNGNFRLKHVQAKKCLVFGLTRLDQMPVFSNPDRITEVSSGENVSKDAFLVMANYFSEFGKVTSVQISNGFLNCDGVDLVDPNSKAGLIFHRFFERIETLDIDIPFLDLQAKGYKKDRSLIEILKRANLPKIKKIKLTGHWRLLISQLPISFILRHPNLEKVNLQLEPFFVHLPPPLRFLDEAESKEVEKGYWDSPNQISFGDCDKTQLKSIIIEGPTMFHIVRNTWMRVILAQRKLEQLKLSQIVRTLPENQGVLELMQFVHLIPLLRGNLVTLTSLELLNFRFYKIVDFEIFQRLKQLKNLKLQKISDGSVSRIVHMTSLPGSLEKLSINGFGCSNMQLKQLAKASHLKNLWKVELVSISHLFSKESRLIPEDVATALLRREVISTFV